MFVLRESRISEAPNARARNRGRGTRAITKLTPSVGVDLTKNAPFKFLHFTIGGCSVYAFPST